MRILVVEDERTPASFIEQGLRAEGHAVTVCHDGESGEAAALTGDYALVLLDLLCPARPASTCLERSARMPEPASDRADRARSRRAERGLDRGANDWVTKPFSLEELWASVRAYLRSPGQRASSVIEAGTSAWICALAALNATVTRCS